MVMRFGASENRM